MAKFTLDFSFCSYCTSCMQTMNEFWKRNRSHYSMFIYLDQEIIITHHEKREKYYYVFIVSTLKVWWPDYLGIFTAVICIQDRVCALIIHNKVIASVICICLGQETQLDLQSLHTKNVELPPWFVLLPCL